MRRPSFQFYPADWRSNAKLRRCSFLERGIWLEVICLMHDSDEYGVLRWPFEDVAQAVGCKVTDLRELARKGVLKGADAGERCEALTYTPRHAGKDGEPIILLPEQAGPIWYSSRMVVDEYVRRQRGRETRFNGELKLSPKGGLGEHFGGAPKSAPDSAPTARLGDGSSSSSASSSSSSASRTPPSQGRNPSSQRRGNGDIQDQRRAG